MGSDKHDQMNSMTDNTATGKNRIYRGNPVRRMHVMVKPTGALCNLDCIYCYYLSKQQLLGKPEQWRISDEVLESFIRQYFEGQNYKEVVFSWQGASRRFWESIFLKKSSLWRRSTARLMCGAKTTFKPTAHSSTNPGASFSMRRTFWWVFPLTARSLFMTPFGKTSPVRAASTGYFARRIS